MPRIPMPDVIVLLPGIMGSALQKDGKDVWDISTGAALAGLFSRGKSLKDLRLPPNSDGMEPDDGIIATDLIPDLHLIPGLWKIDGYRKTSGTIQMLFEVTKDKNYIEFAYDWRLDNRLAARKLASLAHDTLGKWREDTNNPNARLILVAHSMGGLVARYFLEVLEGWRDTRALITFGTPYRGAVNALETLVDGCYKGPHRLLDLSDTVRSFTSVYQLLPTYRCYNGGTSADGWVRIGETTGIPNVDAMRAANALAFHQEIRAAVDRHRQDDEYREKGYRIFPIIGIEQPTRQSARKNGDGVEFFSTYTFSDGTVRDDRGDGTVPRASAIPIELEDNPPGMYAADRHASLQNADAGLTHLKGVIFNLFSPLGEYQAPQHLNATLSLDIDDIYWSGDSIQFRVQPSFDRVTPHATIEQADTMQPIAEGAFLPTADGWQEATLAPLPPNVYRVTVTGGPAVDPVTDIFTVLDPPT